MKKSSSMITYLNKSSSPSGLHVSIHAMFRNDTNNRTADLFIDRWNFSTGQDKDFEIWFGGDGILRAEHKVKVVDYKSARALVECWLTVV